MKVPFTTIASVLLLLAVAPGCSERDEAPVVTGPYLGQEPPGMVPTLFAPGIITTEYHEHSSPVFSPDGNEVYWSVFYNFWGPQVIVYMREESGRWTPPRVAPFSGRYSDGNPCLSPDGRRLFFESRRPIREGDPYTGETDLWVVEREGEAWGEPRHLGSKVNSDKWDRGPSISGSGNLYFCSMRDGGYGGMDLYRSRLVDGSYSEPENLGSRINTSDHESWPFIAADESYVIYESGSGDLHIAFKSDDDSWSEPISMAEALDSGGPQDRFPRVSNDGKYLFFVSNRWLGNPYPDARLDLEAIKERSREISNGMGNVFWVDAGIIERLRPSFAPAQVASPAQ